MRLAQDTFIMFETKCYFINIILDNNIIFIVSLFKKKLEANYCHECSIYYSSYQAPSWLLQIVAS
jgi:hypothetical protein